MVAHGRRTRWLLLLLVGSSFSAARAEGGWTPHRLERLNARLHGHIIDYTHNHDADRRMWSQALQQPRDLYVYLPPGFDPTQCYPLLFWLHPHQYDEQLFLAGWAADLDSAMVTGKLPSMIVVVPDGSFKGRPTLSPFQGSSFFLNSRAGNFEDFLIQDVWNFVVERYPIRPEREAHALLGLSMGGFAAFNQGIKYRERFANVIGVLPPLNLRWLDCHGRYQGNFNPCCWGWRTDLIGPEVIGRYYGLYTLRMGPLVKPLFGRGPAAVAELSRENPLEMLDTFAVREGDLGMYVGYAGRDNFNLDAQAESFLYRARQLGLTVTVGYDPRGTHDFATMRRLMPGALQWLAPRLAPFSPARTLCTLPPGPPS